MRSSGGRHSAAAHGFAASCDRLLWACRSGREYSAGIDVSRFAARLPLDSTPKFLNGQGKVGLTPSAFSRSISREIALALNGPAIPAETAAYVGIGSFN